MIGDVLQPTHLIFILVVALLVLGPKRLPEVGRSLGKGIRDFRGALSGLDEHMTGDPEPPASLPVNVAPITPATVAEPSGAPAPEPVTAGVVPAPVAVDGTIEPVIGPDATSAGREGDRAADTSGAPVAPSAE